MGTDERIYEQSSSKKYFSDEGNRDVFPILGLGNLTCSPGLWTP